jgi:hypothetical protein
MALLVIMKPNAKLIRLIVKVYSREDKWEANREPYISMSYITPFSGPKQSVEKYPFRIQLCLSPAHRLSTVLKDLVRTEFLAALSLSIDTQP